MDATVPVRVWVGVRAYICVREGTVRQDTESVVTTASSRGSRGQGAWVALDQKKYIFASRLTVSHKDKNVSHFYVRVWYTLHPASHYSTGSAGGEPGVSGVFDDRTFLTTSSKVPQGIFHHLVHG